MDTPIEFHSAKAKRLSNDGDLREVVDESLREFGRKKPLNDRINMATTVASVWPAGPDEYYAVLIVGPAKNLDTLSLGLTGAAMRAIPDARKTGIK